ncbi:hypothetical protein ONV78_15955 [Hahella sp. CR1]|uniref:hypothetical protein n=1 Tax=Hahella sp. CR1 TaxID=2992807 RepID=UPI002442FCA2|nr:hypothetical protein [Hahella sp. CR1]MDG9669236.1 hypothetical protein [Hahella sp. CR1]
MEQMAFSECRIPDQKEQRVALCHDVDSTQGLIHSLEATEANVHDITVVDKLLHGEENLSLVMPLTKAFVSVRYTESRRVSPGSSRNVLACARILSKDHQRMGAFKASIRAKMEHPFRYIKQVFGNGKVRYRGLAKNRQKSLLCYKRVMRHRNPLKTCLIIVNRITATSSREIYVAQDSLINPKIRVYNERLMVNP